MVQSALILSFFFSLNLNRSISRCKIIHQILCWDSAASFSWMSSILRFLLLSKILFFLTCPSYLFYSNVPLLHFCHIKAAQKKKDSKKMFQAKYYNFMLNIFNKMLRIWNTKPKQKSSLMPRDCLSYTAAATRSLSQNRPRGAEADGELQLPLWSSEWTFLLVESREDKSILLHFHLRAKQQQKKPHPIKQ